MFLNELMNKKKLVYNAWRKDKRVQVRAAY